MAAFQHSGVGRTRIQLLLLLLLISGPSRLIHGGNTLSYLVSRCRGLMANTNKDSSVLSATGSTA